MKDYVIPEKLPGFAKEHARRYLESGGREGHVWDTSPSGVSGTANALLLFTVGRKSGDTLVIPLIYGKRGDDYVVIASKGGFPSHPEWYRNLRETPGIEIQVGEDRLNVRARDAEGRERDELWNLMVDIFPPYEEYRKKTDREIPVVVLEPV